MFGSGKADKTLLNQAVAALNAGGRGTAGTRDGLALQRSLTVLQMSVSLVLLAGALLLGRSFWKLTSLHPGFRQDGIFVTHINFARVKISPERRDAFKAEMLETIRAVPQVQSAALTTHVPVISGSWTMGLRVTGGQVDKEAWSKVAWVSPDYFRTLEIAIVRGRDISEADTATAPKVALVNETFVRQWLDGGNPIGARLRTIAEPGYPEATYEIVGVVKDTKYGKLRSEIPPLAFAPATQHPNSGAYAAVVVRSSAPLPGVMEGVKQRLAQLDPSLRLGTTVLKTRIRDGLARERLLAWLSGFFGVLAVGLVIIGLYGLVSYTTQLRRNELGVRLALGAQRRDILWLVLRQGLRLAIAGAVLGFVGALGLTQFLSSLLFELKPTDPATWLATTTLLIGVAMLAGWLPARRAARADVMQALRYE